MSGTEPEDDSLLYNVNDDGTMKELEVDQLAFKALLEENERSSIDHELSVQTDEWTLEKIVAEIIHDVPEKCHHKRICRICLRSTYDTQYWKLFDKTNWLFCKELREKLDYVAGKINYNVTLDPVVCEQCIKLICTTYDFKKQVEAVEDRILEKAGKSVANSIVDLQSLLDNNASNGCQKEPFQYDEYSDSFQSVESAVHSESNQSTNETHDVGFNENIQVVNESTSSQDVNQNDCTSSDIVQIVLLSLEGNCIATTDTEAGGGVEKENQTDEGPGNGEEVGEKTTEDAEVNGPQSDETLISAVDEKTSNSSGKKRDYPRSFNLFDEEHDRYFEKYKDRPECKLTMKWANFAKRLPQFGNGPFLCPECGIIFQNKPVYIKHLNEHKGEHLVVCAYCGDLVKRHRLMYHVSVNHQPCQVECEDCGKKFRTSQHLATHKKTMHAPEDEWHQCQICGKFLRKNSIRGHIEAHDPTKTYTCDVCGMTFKARSYWVRHKKRHTSTDGVPCSYCGKPFKCKDYLLQHVKQVHKQTDFNCAMCGKRLSNKDALRKHLKNVHAPNRTDKKRKRQPDKQKDKSGDAVSLSVDKVNVSKVRIIQQDKNVIVYNKVDGDEVENSTIILSKIK